jgi:hypothetical protein
MVRWRIGDAFLVHPLEMRDAPTSLVPSAMMRRTSRDGGLNFHHYEQNSLH